MKGIFFGLLLLLCFKSNATTYLSMDSVYTYEELLKSERAYIDTKDSIGLAYTYIIMLDHYLPNRKIKYEVFKRVLKYHDLLRNYNTEDYYRARLLVGNFIIENQYGLHKGLELFHEGVAYAKAADKPEIFAQAVFSIANAMVTSAFEEENSTAAYDLIKKEMVYYKKRWGTVKLHFFIDYYAGRHFLLQKDYAQATHHFKKALQGAQAIGFRPLVIPINIYLCKTHRLQKKYNTALNYLKVGEKMGNDVKDNGMIVWAYEEYALLNKALKRFKQAADYWEKKNELIKIHEAEGYHIDRSSFMMEYLEDSFKKETKISDLKSKLQKSQIKQQNTVLFIMVFISLLIIIIFIGYVQLAKSRQKQLNNEIKLKFIEGQEREREYMASQLHESVGGTIVALKYALPMTLNNYETIRMYIDTMYFEIRQTAHTLSTALLQKTSLPEATRSFLRLFQNKLSIRFEILGNEYPIPYAARLHLFRIIQELASNAVKHAKATNISLTLCYYDDKIIINIEDDGIGFIPETNKNGIGLLNIEQRISLLNGHFHIESKPNDGTMMWVDVPKPTSFG